MPSYKKLPTHTPLDGILGGGVERGIVTEVYGPAGAGKTNFCIHFSLSAAERGKVAYLDTEGGLSAERVRQIAGGTKIMKNILVKRVTDFWQQEETVGSLVCKKKGLSGVVVDSIVMLYRLALTDKTASEVNKSLANQLHALSLLAESSKIPVLVTNQVYTPSGEKEYMPVAGDVLRYWPKTILSIEPTGTGTVMEMGARTATIVKHRSIAEGERCDFSITAKGFE